MIRLLNLGPAKHEKVAIYVVNQRISNVCGIAGAASQRSNSQASVGLRKHEMRSNPCIIGGKIPFDPNIISITKTIKTKDHLQAWLPGLLPAEIKYPCAHPPDQINR